MNFIIDSPTKRQTVKSGCGLTGFPNPTHISDFQHVVYETKQTTNRPPFKDFLEGKNKSSKNSCFKTRKSESDQFLIDSNDQVDNLEAHSVHESFGWRPTELRQVVFVRLPGPSTKSGGTTSKCQPHLGDVVDVSWPSNNTTPDQSRIEELCDLAEPEAKFIGSKVCTESASIFLKSNKYPNLSSVWSMGKSAAGIHQIRPSSGNGPTLAGAMETPLSAGEIDLLRFEGHQAEAINQFERGLVDYQREDQPDNQLHSADPYPRDSSPGEVNIRLDTSPCFAEFLQAEPAFMEYLRMVNSTRTGTSTSPIT